MRLSELITPGAVAGACGLAGTGFGVAGVYVLAGTGWALVAAAMPFLIVSIALLRGISHGQ